MTLLDVRELSIGYPGNDRPVVRNLSFAIGPGESVGLIGESGSGKTQTALALMGLLPPRARATGSVRCDGEELLGAGEKTLNRFRPCHMAMVFQDPREALNPYLRVGDQLERIVTEHRLAAGSDAPARVLDALRRVGLPDPERQMFAYPHQLSGGMRQRAMIAAALIGEPRLLIADEPTTALDVTVQAQILELLRSLRREFDAALLLITHDLGVVAGNCERMLVIDRGELVEEGATRDLFASARNERTRAMVAAAPPLGDIPVVKAGARDDPILLAGLDIRVSHFEKPYRAVWRRDEIKAVRDVGLEVRKGETLALVGESGSGKTTLARALSGLLPPVAGEFRFLGQALPASVAARSDAQRRGMQLVFQDPAGSLNPVMRVADIVAEPLRVMKPRPVASERRATVERMLQRVGLQAALGARFPHELSGGQAQRVALARALVVRPALLVCDEAVAALDGTVRAGILALIRAEQEQSGLSVLFISHDLSVVKRISHRILVMYMGRICEEGESAQIFRRPRHPYTRALIDSVPVPDPARQQPVAEVRGEVASLLTPPSGCVFHPRCRYAVERCRVDVPALPTTGGQRAACHRADELDLSL